MATTAPVFLSSEPSTPATSYLSGLAAVLGSPSVSAFSALADEALAYAHKAPSAALERFWADLYETFAAEARELAEREQPEPKRRRRGWIR